MTFNINEDDIPSDIDGAEATKYLIDLPEGGR